MGNADIAELRERLHVAHVDERRRIARELHDIVAPALAVVLHDLELAQHYRSVDPERAEQKIRNAVGHVRTALDQLRSVSAGMRHDIAQHGLVASLRDYLCEAAFDQPTQLHLDGDEAILPRGVRGELFLVLREALRNAHRHAAATIIEVAVIIEPCRVRATVRDNGIGFVADCTRQRGLGLVSMRERISAFGGEVTVRPGVTGGTEVVVELPLPKEIDAGPE